MFFRFLDYSFWTILNIWVKKKANLIYSLRVYLFNRVIIVSATHRSRSYWLTFANLHLDKNDNYIFRSMHIYIYNFLQTQHANMEWCYFQWLGITLGTCLSGIICYINTLLSLFAFAARCNKIYNFNYIF